MIHYVVINQRRNHVFGKRYIHIFMAIEDATNVTSSPNPFHSLSGIKWCHFKKLAGKEATVVKYIGGYYNVFYSKIW